MDRIADLKNKIKSITEESWNNGEPLLLARLGSHDQGEISRIAKSISGSVRNFIETHMIEEVKIVRHSRNNVVVAVVPINDETNSMQNFDELLSALSSSKNEPRFRFAPAVWAAFRKPLDSGHKRLLNVSRRSFSDVDKEYVIGADEKEVPREVLLPDENVEDGDIHSQIVKWARNNSVDPELLTYDNLGSSIGRKEIGLLPKTSVLDRLLFALDVRDLEKTSMTLDVVKKLRVKS